MTTKCWIRTHEGFFFGVEKMGTAEANSAVKTQVYRVSTCTKLALCLAFMFVHNLNR